MKVSIPFASERQQNSPTEETSERPMQEKHIKNDRKGEEWFLS
jgi:hypothetical protein